MEVSVPLLSVIVPVYNGIKYLKQTIKYLQNSEYDNIEIILIDDGSTDGSKELCDDLCRNDKRIKCVHTVNRGIAAARNTGVSAATGEYICFCDQDDEVEPYIYKELMLKITINKADVGICSTGRIIEGKKSEYERLTDACYIGNDVKEYLLYPILFLGFKYDFAKEENYLYGTLWKCIFDKKFFVDNNITFRRYLNYEDDLLAVTQALASAKKVVTVSTTGYYWRINANSESHTVKFIQDIFMRFQELDKDILDFMVKSGIKNEIIEEYKSVTMCGHYIDAYKNYAGLSKESRKIKSTYIKEIKKYLKSTNYKSRLKCTKYLKKTALRKNVIYFMLKCRALRLAATASRLVDILESSLTKSQLIVKCERKLKRG